MAKTLRNWEFFVPTRIALGGGGVRMLGPLVQPLGRSVLLVGYRDCPPLKEVYAKAAESLGKAGLVVNAFLEVTGEPDGDLVARGAAAAVGHGAEVVLAIGGGSVIDAAKGIAMIACSGGGVWDYADANPARRLVTEALPIVAVPTTAGTGAEVTDVAVLHRAGDEAAADAAKISITAPVLRPRVAVVDPDLLQGMPTKALAACAVDALGHAIEAAMSRAANPISRLMAREAVGLIYRSLPLALETPEATEPREALALAATLAGLAFSMSGVTMAHSVAHALGAVLGMPHSEAVAIATPLGLRYNAEACGELFAELAASCGLEGDFVEGVTALIASLGLPQHIAAHGHNPADLADLAARLAKNAFATTPQPLRLNPRKIDEATLESLLAALIRK